jgi:flagellar biosynthesis/type III secretory pathway protein FliH
MLGSVAHKVASRPAKVSQRALASLARFRRMLSVWLKMLLRRKAPGANMADIEDINDLLEADTMLEQTIERWFDEATDKGVQKGLLKGLEKGLEKGRQEGRQEGLVRAVGLQLQLRFGAMPQRVQASLTSATEEQLLQWAGVILTANSLQDLFGPDDGV